MPSTIAKGNITVRRYLVLDPLPTERMREPLTKGIRAHSFMPLDPRSELTESRGWVSCRDSDDADLHQEKLFFVATGGEQVRMSYRMDTMKPPPDQVKRALQQRVAELEANEGRMLGRRERQVVKEEVVRTLKLRVFPKTKVIDMAWFLDARRIYFWSQSKTANEAFVDLFAKSFGLRIDVEDASRWAHELLGEVTKQTLEPTKELWQGFAGVRPITAGFTEDMDEE